MIKLSRRNFVNAGLSSAGVAMFNINTRSANAAEFTYKFANNWAETHPINVRMREAITKIREESGGRIEIQTFANSVLGGDIDMLSQLRAGGIHFFTLSGLILSNLVPLSSVYGVAYSLDTYKKAWAAVDGDLGEFMRKAVRATGLECMDKNWDNGYRQFITGTKPINTPDDLRGLKIRVPPSPMWTSVFQAFESAPASITWSEVYSALQTHIVDGAENALVSIEVSKLYEVQKYVAMTNYMWDNYYFLANRRAWSALPENLQQIVSNNINSAAMLERADMEALDKTLEAELTQRGLVFNRPESAPFRQKLISAGYYKTWREKFGPEAWGLLEKYAGTLS